MFNLALWSNMFCVQRMYCPLTVILIYINTRTSEAPLNTNNMPPNTTSITIGTTNLPPNRCITHKRTPKIHIHIRTPLQHPPTIPPIQWKPTSWGQSVKALNPPPGPWVEETERQSQSWSSDDLNSSRMEPGYSRYTTRSWPPDDFEIGKPLGDGNCARFYLFWETSLRYLVALKYFYQETFSKGEELH